VSKQWIGRQLPDTSVQGRRSTDSIASPIASPIATDHSDHDTYSDTISNTADTSAAATASTAGPGGVDQHLLLHKLGAVSDRSYQHQEGCF